MTRQQLGKIDEVSVREFAARLRAVTESLPQSTHRAQLEAAELLATRLRTHLQQGVSPELSPFSEAIDGEHPALSTLAKHVIVEKPKGMQARWKPGTVRRGAKVGGRFTSSFGPAVVTFAPDWLETAYKLQNGYMWQVKPEVRTALFAVANANGFVGESGAATGGIWYIPPRDFMACMDDEVSRIILEKAAEKLLEDDVEGIIEMRKLLTFNKDENKTTDSGVEHGSRFVGFDDAMRTVIDESMDINDMIDNGYFDED